MVTRRWEAETRMVSSCPQPAVSLPDDYDDDHDDDHDHDHDDGDDVNDDDDTWERKHELSDVEEAANAVAGRVDQHN